MNFMHFNSKSAYSLQYEIMVSLYKTWFYLYLVKNLWQEETEKILPLSPNVCNKNKIQVVWGLSLGILYKSRFY